MKNKTEFINQLLTYPHNSAKVRESKLLDLQFSHFRSKLKFSCKYDFYQ